MEVTQEMLDHLKEDILLNTSEASSSNITMFDFGAIWHGDFYRHAKFGSPQKNNHYAMIADKSDCILKPSRKMSPATSVRNSGRKVLRLPPGALKSKTPDHTYILLGIKLLVSCSQLSSYFKFVQHLEVQYMQEAERIINNV